MKKYLYIIGLLFICLGFTGCEEDEVDSYYPPGGGTSTESYKVYRGNSTAYNDLVYTID